MNRKYRPDIDGIRAIAILSVLFFHAGFAFFSGGYVGVDVFFVISGFLITRLIRDEIEVGSFSFVNFYARRARRLFPSLFVTIAVSFILAVLMFSPEHMHRFAGELIYALTSLSNFYFWGESGYFDADAHFKPLLHTWSLSVEEQFYLFWPLLLLFLQTRLRGLWVPLSILLFGGGSFVLNLIFQDGAQFLGGVSSSLAKVFGDVGSTIYFLIPFRIFEFSIGAVLVYLMHFRPRGSWSLELLLCLGIVFAIAPVFLYDESLLFPSYYALMPCFGAALMIYAGEARYLGRLLSNPVSVWIGRISYSLYLVHWPVYVFYRYYLYGELNTHEKYLVLVTSFILAILLHHLVEKRYRYPRPVNGSVSSHAAFSFVCALLTIILILPAATAWGNAGWTGRAKEFVVNKNEVSCEKENFCELQQGEKGIALLVGDSHLGHHMKTLLKKFSGYTVRVFNVSACYFGKELYSRDHKHKRGKVCEQANINLRSYITIHGREISYVVHAQRWHGYKERLLFLRDGRVLEGSDNFKYKKMLQDVTGLYDSINVPKFIIGAAPTNTAIGCIERAEFVSMQCRSSEQKNSLLHVHHFKEVSKKFAQKGLSFIHPVDYLCSKRKCRQVIGNKKVYRDHRHLTREGSNLVLRQLKIEG